jgi:dihydroflavonol-4-reductase
LQVLVTGASGFFGKRLIPKLVNSGYKVNTFGRNDLPNSLLPLVNKHYRGNIADINTIHQAMKDIDVVFHLAGLVSYRRCDYEKLYQNNVIGTRNMMTAAMKASVSRVIHMSSIAGMGIPNEGMLADETIEYNLKGLGLHYCDTKHGAELEVLKFVKQGLPALMLAPGITFGEGDTHPHHHTIFASMARGSSIGYPKGGVMFTDIENVVDVCLNSIHRGRIGERYVLGSENVSFYDAAITLSKLIGSRPPKFAIPPWLAESAGYISESVLPLFGLTPTLTRQVAWLSARKIFFTFDKAIAELGLQPIAFKDTVKRTAPYYLRQNI